MVATTFYLHVKMLDKSLMIKINYIAHLPYVQRSSVGTQVILNFVRPDVIKMQVDMWCTFKLACGQVHG